MVTISATVDIEDCSDEGEKIDEQNDEVCSDEEEIDWKEKI